MEQFILIFHFVVAVAIIGLILLQQGKGARRDPFSRGGFDDDVLR